MSCRRTNTEVNASTSVNSVRIPHSKATSPKSLRPIWSPSTQKFSKPEGKQRLSSQEYTTDKTTAPNFRSARKKKKMKQNRKRRSGRVFKILLCLFCIVVSRGQPKIIVLQNLTIPTGKDPVVAASTTKDTIEEGSPDEIFPMFIVSKDETVPIDNMTETWNVVGSYDVEESGALVPFNSDNVLFQGHF
jgi:hypothetical protein